MIPLCLEIDGNIGPFHPDLIDAWNRCSIGDPCPRCGTELVEFFRPLLAICPRCEREHQEALGCKCKGTNLCPLCIEAGATEANRGDVKCKPSCSTLCDVCTPYD